MSLHISEADWRRFKEVRTKSLERFCAQILEEAVALAQSPQGSAYDRYLKLFKLIKERDRRIAQAFDDFRRSTAVIQLGIMRRLKLVTDEELAGFSEETRIRVQGVASL